MAYLLIIDDDEDFASLTAEVLRDAGYEVAIELDHRSAVASMEARRPNLVILDVMFPGDSSAGFKLARAMQSHDEKLKGIPVLMLTAGNTWFPLRISAGDIDDKWLPVSDFLEKPVDFEFLKTKVSELLRQASQDQDAGRSGSSLTR